jgi:prepilin-type N-terminal cleavage/methylation domain-containing protein
MKERLFDKSNHQGFTLVELVVALAMSLIIMAAVYITFRTQLYSFQLAEQTAPVQQGVRVAKVFLERDIRMAGANMVNTTYQDATLYPVDFVDDNPAGDAGTDQLTVVYIDYFGGSCGSATPPAVSCDDLPSLTLTDNMPIDAAAAEIEEELGDSPYSLWDGDCECAGETYGTPPNDRYRAKITSPDGSRSDIVYITNVSNNGAGTDDKLINANYNGFDNKVLNTYPAGSIISFFSETAYTEVTYDLVGGNLRRNGATIAENIEDLQFAFGLDTDDDDIVDSWVDNHAVFTANPEKTFQIRLVRITILGRSAREIFNGALNSRPAIENHAESTTSDRYQRRQLELTVKVRNLGI